MQTPYKFTLTSGMPGYMPNYVSGAFVVYTRKELANILRDELDMLSYPAARFNDFNVKRMWRFIQNAKSGSSCHSYCDTHNNEQLSVNGLTDAEYDELVANEDW